MTTTSAPAWLLAARAELGTRDIVGRTHNNAPLAFLNTALMPLGGLLYGIGLGMLGKGIFKLAGSYLQKAGAALSIETKKRK